MRLKNQIEQGDFIRDETGKAIGNGHSSSYGWTHSVFTQHEDGHTTMCLYRILVCPDTPLTHSILKALFQGIL